MFTSPRPHGGLKPPWYLLERPCSRAQAIQQVSGGHRWQLLDTGDWEADEWGDTAEPHAYKQGDIVLGDVKFGKNLDDTVCVMVKVSIMKAGNKAKSRITAPDFSRTGFGLFRDQGLVLSNLKISKARDSLSTTLPVNIFSPLPLPYLLSFHGVAAGSSCVSSAAKHFHWTVEID